MFFLIPQKPGGAPRGGILKSFLSLFKFIGGNWNFIYGGPVIFFQFLLFFVEKPKTFRFKGGGLGPGALKPNLIFFFSQKKRGLNPPIQKFFFFFFQNVTFLFILSPFYFTYNPLCKNFIN